MAEEDMEPNVMQEEEAAAEDENNEPVLKTEQVLEDGNQPEAAEAPADVPAEKELTIKIPGENDVDGGGGGEEEGSGTSSGGDEDQKPNVDGENVDQEGTPGNQLKRKRNLPGNPDPDAEVVALSPRTLLATNRFVCEICHKGFQRDQNLQLHRRGHNLPWKLRQRSATEVKKKVYVCPEPSCLHHDPARALGDLTGIKKHYSRKHGEKKYKCEKCSKKYAVQSDWKAHMKSCGTREYRCDCGTLFSRRDSFITHRAFCDALADNAPPGSKSDDAIAGVTLPRSAAGLSSPFSDANRMGLASQASLLRDRSFGRTPADLTRLPGKPEADQQLLKSLGFGNNGQLLGGNQGSGVTGGGSSGGGGDQHLLLQQQQLLLRQQQQQLQQLQKQLQNQLHQQGGVGGNQQQPGSSLLQSQQSLRSQQQLQSPASLGGGGNQQQQDLSNLVNGRLSSQPSGLGLWLGQGPVPNAIGGQSQGQGQSQNQLGSEPLPFPSSAADQLQSLLSGGNQAGNLLDSALLTRLLSGNQQQQQQQQGQQGQQQQASVGQQSSHQQQQQLAGGSRFLGSASGQLGGFAQSRQPSLSSPQKQSQVQSALQVQLSPTPQQAGGLLAGLDLSTLTSLLTGNASGQAGGGGTVSGSTAAVSGNAATATLGNNNSGAPLFLGAPGGAGSTANVSTLLQSLLNSNANQNHGGGNNTQGVLLGSTLSNNIGPNAGFSDLSGTLASTLNSLTATGGNSGSGGGLFFGSGGEEDNALAGFLGKQGAAGGLPGGGGPRESLQQQQQLQGAGGSKPAGGLEGVLGSLTGAAANTTGQGSSGNLLGGELDAVGLGGTNTGSGLNDASGNGGSNSSYNMLSRALDALGGNNASGGSGGLLSAANISSLLGSLQSAQGQADGKVLQGLEPLQAGAQQQQQGEQQQQQQSLGSQSLQNVPNLQSLQTQLSQGHGQGRQSNAQQQQQQQQGQQLGSNNQSLLQSALGMYSESGGNQSLLSSALGKMLPSLTAQGDGTAGGLLDSSPYASGGGTGGNAGSFNAGTYNSGLGALGPAGLLGLLQGMGGQAGGDNSLGGNPMTAGGNQTGGAGGNEGAGGIWLGGGEGNNNGGSAMGGGIGAVGQGLMSTRSDVSGQAEGGSLGASKFSVDNLQSPPSLQRAQSQATQMLLRSASRNNQSGEFLPSALQNLAGNLLARAQSQGGSGSFSRDLAALGTVTRDFLGLTQPTGAHDLQGLAGLTNPMTEQELASSVAGP